MQHDSGEAQHPAARRRSPSPDQALVLLTIVVIAVATWNLLESLAFQFARDTIGNATSLRDVRAFPYRTGRIIFWVVMAVAVVFWLVRLFSRPARPRRPWLVPILLLSGVIIHFVSMTVAGVGYVQDKTFTITVWDCPATVDNMTLQRSDRRCTERPIDPISWAILDDGMAGKTIDSGIAPTAHDGNTATWSGLPQGSYGFFLILDDNISYADSIVLVWGDQYPTAAAMTSGKPQHLTYWYGNLMSDVGDVDVYFSPSEIPRG